MCGRFSLHLTDLAAVAAALGITLPTDSELPAWEARYNVAPTQRSPIAIGGEQPALIMARWGLVAHWAKDPSAGTRAINARVETAADKPTFRDAWRAQRCVVPATGYFEWQRIDDKTRAPTWIHPRDGSIMHLAGLWSTWRSNEGQRLDTFSILTQPSRDFVEAIHDRMPIELSASAAHQWLAPVDSAMHAHEVLRRGSRGTSHLEARAVGKVVGNPRNDSAQCIEAVDAPAPRPQLTFDELFGG